MQQNTFKIVKTCNFRKLYLPWFSIFFQSVESSGSEILQRLTHYNIIFAKKILVCKNFEFLKKNHIFKKSNLIFENFLKIEKKISDFFYFLIVLCIPLGFQNGFVCQNCQISLEVTYLFVKVVIFSVLQIQAFFRRVTRP